MIYHHGTSFHGHLGKMAWVFILWNSRVSKYEFYVVGLKLSSLIVHAYNRISIMNQSIMNMTDAVIL